MTQKIIKLPSDLANQIAAGEVVERPASVVKELIENALDAGASEVRITLEESGTKSIGVRDNGSGISPSDLPLVLEKYTTSKIKTLQDLYSVMTFGFRGEALASIASVSEFSLRSKTANNLAGKELKDGEISDIAMETGTHIIIQNLFHNTPARLNYLKTPRTEYLRILDVVQKFALSHPHVAFELSNDGKKMLSFSQSQGIDIRLAEILGGDCSQNLLSLRHEFGGIHISGYISDPKVSYQNRSKQYIFLNGRSINSPIIAKALFDGYKRFIAPKTQAAYVLFINIDPTEVDVNVHPRKLEVRFSNEQMLFRSVYHSVKEKLEQVSLISPHPKPLSGEEGIHSLQNHDTASSIPLKPSTHKVKNGMKAYQKMEKQEQYYTGSGTKFKNYSPYKDVTSNPAQHAIDFSKRILDSDTNQNTQQESLTQDVRETPLGRIIGQVHNAYIIVETQSGIKILDQHALAERVIYEKISAHNYSPKSQKLIVGESFHLSNQEYESLDAYTELIENMGFEFEILPHNTVTLYGIPDYVKQTNLENSFKNILSDISSEGSRSLDDIRERLWAFTACRSAIKFGDPLSLFEMNKLLHDASIEYSSTCPHGRPVVYDISLEELLGKYQR